MSGKFLAFFTGNETCAHLASTTDSQFSIKHYFRDPSLYTVLIILKNDVSKVVTKVGINIYEGKYVLPLSDIMSVSSAFYSLVDDMQCRNIFLLFFIETVCVLNVVLR
jgi:hypothetical protein